MAQLCCGKIGCGTACSSSLEGISAKKKMNKKAIAERGWGPLNYILLDHPELKMMQQQTSRIEAAYQHLKITGILPANPSDLNTDHGMAGNLMEKLVDHARVETGHATKPSRIMPLQMLTLFIKRCWMHQGLWQESSLQLGTMS